MSYDDSAAELPNAKLSALEEKAFLNPLGARAFLVDALFEFFSVCARSWEKWEMAWWMQSRNMLKIHPP